MQLKNLLTLATSVASVSAGKAKLDTIYQFEKGSWIENVAVRSNGHLLVTLMDRPELYEVNPFNSSAKLLHRFDEAAALGLTSITEVQPDVFALIAGNFSLATTSSTTGSYSLWQVDLNRGAQNLVSKIGAIPEGNFLDGITTLNATAGTILVSDSGTGIVYRVDTATGEYEAVLEDDSMKPEDGNALVIGVDGIRYSNGYLYYVNFPLNHFCRVKIDPSTGKATGPYQTVATNVTGDDFAITNTGIAYVAGNFQNILEKVYPNGTSEVIAGSSTSADVCGLTSAAFGRTIFDNDKLYVVTSGALANPVNGTYSEGGKIVRVDL